MSAARKHIAYEAAHEYIAQLDLSYIIDAMCAESYPMPRWTREDAVECCKRYKNFLLLHKKHLPKPLVPTRLIDEFWHNHILYTKQYMQDCDNIFGHYLHHQPASLDEGAESLVDEFRQTKALYEQAFNTPF